jgi:hypothetical protein
MLIAQAMGEYGGLASLAATFSTLMNRAESTISGFGTREWALIGVACVVVIVVLGRRR